MQILAFKMLLSLAFKMPILVINTSHFGVLNAKTVLWNLLKVKHHFWRIKCRRLVFMKWTLGWCWVVSPFRSLDDSEPASKLPNIFFWLKRTNLKRNTDRFQFCRNCWKCKIWMCRKINQHPKSLMKQIPLVYLLIS